jgi:hypothetical protein
MLIILVIAILDAMATRGVQEEEEVHLSWLGRSGWPWW